MKANSYEQNHAVFCFEHFLGCDRMQRAVDQRGLGRFAGADADGVEPRGFSVHVANRQTTQSSGGDLLSRTSQRKPAKT